MRPRSPILTLPVVGVEVAGRAMPTFDYTAVTGTGERVVGALAGASQQAVLAELESRRLIPIEVSPRRRGPRGRGVSSRQLATAYGQLADLLRAGVPLLRGLQILSRRRAAPRIAAAFRDVAETVAGGAELADALAAHPRLFPRVHVAMVRAGERGGFLEDVLARLAAFVEAQAELRGRIVGSLVYPCVLVVFGALICGVLFGVLMPRFEPMFAQLERLPALTRLAFGVSAAMGTYAPVTAAVLVVLGAAGWRVARRPRVRWALARVRARVPVLGPVSRLLAASRFCRMLGTLLGNGVTILEAMAIARESAGDPLLESAIERAADAVRAGEPLADPLGASGLFDEDLVEMIAVAEAANNLDRVLVKLADGIDARVDRALSLGVRLLEPLMLLLIAGVVVLVALALLLPMFQLSASLR